MILLAYVLARVLGIKSMPPTTIVASWFYIVNNCKSGMPWPRSSNGDGRPGTKLLGPSMVIRWRLLVSPTNYAAVGSFRLASSPQVSLYTPAMCAPSILEGMP